jgi:hypothetical protein
VASVLHVRQDAAYTVGTAYDRVYGQLSRLAAQLDLADGVERIMQTFDAVCRRSLAFPLAGSVPRFSRINPDGTPFQFAVTAGAPAPALEFLGDAGWAGASGAARLRAGRACIAAVAHILDADAELHQIEGLLRQLAPENARALLADNGGAFWIGAGFKAPQMAALRIYVNGAWGNESDRWSRLHRLAAHFELLEPWHEARSILPCGMKPLGGAITIARNGAATGRIYVSGYGNRIEQYLALARRVSGEHFAGVLGQYAECLLRDDVRYPTPTAVCSFGLSAGRPLEFKLELCCHCLFESDVEASTRLRECFDAAGADAAEYLRVLDVLSEGRLDRNALRLHSYAGVGSNHDREYFPVYLQPALGSPR